MSILRRDGDDGDSQEEAHVRQKERQATGAALEQQQKQTLAVNPGFLAELQDFDLDTEEFPVTGELGPLASGSAVLGNREDHYENQQHWLNQNKAERIAAEGDPGRLCKGRIREIAFGVHERDRDPPRKRTPDERRAIRAAMERITNVESLSVNARLLRSLTESVAVTRTEGDEGTAEKASRLIG